MNPEKSITICGKEVRMRYCAATEKGYENLTDKKITIFSYTPTEWDAEGKPTAFEPPTATEDDYITLAVAAIVAAYARNKEEPPVTSEDILYDASSDEVSNMKLTVVLLRAEWYKVPDVVKPEIKTDAKGKRAKNSQAPTTSSKK